MSKRTLWTVTIAILGMSLSALLILLHGFRIEHQDNKALGAFEYRYRWWKPHELAVDSNRDGSIDAKAILAAEANGFSGPLKDYWEDRNFDGQFEIHAMYSGDQIVAVDFDKDFDGVYERRFTGADAAIFFDRFRKLTDDAGQGD